MRPSQPVHVALLGCTAAWGLVFIGVHELLPVLDSTQIVTLRFAIISAVVVVALVARPELRPRFSRREWPVVVVCAVLAVPATQLCIVYGQQFLSPPLASLVVTTSPAFAAVMAASLLGERIGVTQVAGLGLALVGVAVVVGIGAGHGSDVAVKEALPATVAILTPVAWAVYTVMSKPLAARHGATGAVGVTLVVGTIFLLPFAFHSVDAAVRLDLSSWLWLGYLAVGGTVVPYTIWFASLRTLPASKTAAYMYLIPAFALGWTLLLLHQAPRAAALAGGVLVVGGVALAQFGSPPVVTAPAE
ncbi:MAG: DMT family transporter [Acidimicrobiales bacterium]